MIYRNNPLTVLAICMITCSAINQGMAAPRNLKGFSEIGEYVFVENANDLAFGKRINEIVPLLRDSVERKQYQKIEKMIPIYLCHTNESFCKYTGCKFPGPRAIVTSKGFFISPRLEPSKDWYELVCHELSHVAMLDNIGLLRDFLTPVWFHEGLATYIVPKKGYWQCDSDNE